ncbi:MAG: protease modulator HflC [Pseudomonadota bacterium]|nr:protease modulator HflC [Pseudomonadota bacterium]
MRNNFLLIIAVVAVIVVYSSMYRVREEHQALIVQFGRIVSGPITESGLHWKLPFIQDVRFYEKRLLTWDGDPEQVPTKDKKYILVDTTARWKISDPVKYAQVVINEQGAQNKLNGIIDGITRDTISNHNLVESVRNDNQILTQRQEAEARQAQADADRDATDAVSDIEEEIMGEIEAIEVGREELSQIIIGRAREELKVFGIELIDVQLRSITYVDSVQQKVYQRMISERKRIAEKIRSVGKGEGAKISGKINKDLKTIESDALRRSEIIKGEADAEAIAIYAAQLRRDPEFFEFYRTLEAYRNTLTSRVNMLMSSDSKYLHLLNKGASAAK